MMTMTKYEIRNWNSKPRCLRVTMCQHNLGISIKLLVDTKLTIHLRVLWHHDSRGLWLVYWIMWWRVMSTDPVHGTSASFTGRQASGSSNSVSPRSRRRCKYVTGSAFSHATVDWKSQSDCIDCRSLNVIQKLNWLTVFNQSINLYLYQVKKPISSKPKRIVK